MKKKTRWISILSNVSFGLAIALTIYLLISLYIIKKDLPLGVCPVDKNRALMYGTIGLAVISFVLSIIESRLKKG